MTAIFDIQEMEVIKYETALYYMLLITLFVIITYDKDEDV
jgi:hypothetical protein